MREELLLNELNELNELRAYLKQIFYRLELRDAMALPDQKISYQEEALYWADYIRNIRIREHFYTCL